MEYLKHDVSFVVQRVSRSHFIEAFVLTVLGNAARHRTKIVVLFSAATTNRSFVRIAVLIRDTRREISFVSSLYSKNWANSPQSIEISPSVIQMTTDTALLMSHARKQMLRSKINDRLWFNAETIRSNGTSWNSPGWSVEDVEVGIIENQVERLSSAYPHHPWSRTSEINPDQWFKASKFFGKDSSLFDKRLIDLTRTRGSNVPKR